MAENKKSFLLYCDLIHTVSQLPDDKAGLLFKHLLSYVNDENPISDDLIVNISFEPIKQQLKRDLQKYDEVRIKRSEAGKKGGRPKQTEAKKANALFEKQTEAKKAVTVSDSDSDSDSEKEKKDTFILFWNQYHNITKLPKTDKDSACKYWNKLNIEEQRKAYLNIDSYFKSVENPKYCKKARTYLFDKNYNDEFVDSKISNKIGKYIELTEKEKQDRLVNINWTYVHYKDTYKKVHSSEKGEYIENGKERVYL